MIIVVPRIQDQTIFMPAPVSVTPAPIIGYLPASPIGYNHVLPPNIYNSGTPGIYNSGTPGISINVMGYDPLFDYCNIYRTKTEYHVALNQYHDSIWNMAQIDWIWEKLQNGYKGNICVQTTYFEYINLYFQHKEEFENFKVWLSNRSLVINFNFKNDSEEIHAWLKDQEFDYRWSGHHTIKFPTHEAAVLFKMRWV